MAENFNLIFGSQAPTTATWTDADYQTGWSTVGSTPPTAEQFDFLQNRADTKAKELNDMLTPLVQKSEADGRQAGTIYASGACVTVDGLPNGWLLECVVPGTSGTVAITLPDPLIDGATIIDGTVTWALRKVATNGGLGYRQPNETVTAGTIRYHQSLPVGWYLECTTAGTTGSGALVITSPSVNDTVADGTVVWTVRQSGYGLDAFSGGVLKTVADGSIRRGVDDGIFNLVGGTNGALNPNIMLYGKDSGNPGVIQLISRAGENNATIMRVKPNGELQWAGNDLAGSAIVAKSLGANGYIKYQSGLIIQYGSALVGSTLTQIDFPISFTHNYSIIANYEWSAPVKTSFWAKTLSSVKLMNDTGRLNANWFAIGY